MKITVELDDTDIDELIAFILEYKKLKDKTNESYPQNCSNREGIDALVTPGAGWIAAVPLDQLAFG